MYRSGSGLRAAAPGGVGRAEEAAPGFYASGLLTELEETESAAAENGWTVGYLDVLLLLLTLFAVLLGVTYMRVAETDRQTPPEVTLDLELPIAAKPPAEIDPRTLFAVFRTRPAAAAERAPVAETVPGKAARVPPPRPEPEPNPKPVVKVTAPPPPQPAAVPIRSELPPALRQLAELASASAGDLLELFVGDREVRMEVRDEILFPLGSAELGEGGRALLDRLAGMLAEQETAIAIEGHTDDLPIATARFPSNWELSSYRATAVARYLIGRGVPAQRLRATGYADTRPRLPNDSPGNRARNRRVSVVLHLPAADAPQGSPEPAGRPGWRRL